jgi:hypothetical protein
VDSDRPSKRPGAEKLREFGWNSSVSYPAVTAQMREEKQMRKDEDRANGRFEEVQQIIYLGHDDSNGDHRQ